MGRSAGYSGTPLLKKLGYAAGQRTAPSRAPASSARKRLAPNGMVWVSWPKKAAKVATDVTEQMVRERGIAAGLVDIKVCAIDATWSGLKFVIPKADR